MGNEIKLTIHIKTMDMFWFFMKHFYSSFSGIFGVIVSLGALVFWVLSLGKREPFQMVLLLILASLFTVLQPMQFLMKAYQQVKLSPIYKEPIDYILTEKEICVHQKEETVQIPWENVYKVVESGKAIYIYTSAVHSFIWPKSQTNEKTESIKALIKEKAQADKCKLK